VKLKYPIYAPDRAAADWWGLQNCLDDSIEQVLQLPFKLAVIPAFLNRDKRYFSQFDLVLVTAGEPFEHETLRHWITESGINQHLLLCAVNFRHQQHESNVFYYPYMIPHVFKNFKSSKLNTDYQKPYLFDVMLGSRKRHRDYVFMRLKQDQMLGNSIVTYRDVYKSIYSNNNSPEQDWLYKNIGLDWPYVSSNLDPTWEVDSNVNFDTSRIIPWKIYQQCWYSIICETIEHGGWFFFTEKTMKALLAQRLFVMFSTQDFLLDLKKLGFETFDSVIDESYDSIVDQWQRHSAAYSAVQYLAKQNPKTLLQKIQPVLDHNQNKLIEYYQESTRGVQQFLQQHIPDQYWSL